MFVVFKKIDAVDVIYLEYWNIPQIFCLRLLILYSVSFFVEINILFTMTVYISSSRQIMHDHVYIFIFLYNSCLLLPFRNSSFYKISRPFFRNLDWRPVHSLFEWNAQHSAITTRNLICENMTMRTWSPPAAPFNISLYISGLRLIHWYRSNPTNANAALNS